jgi:hypothetical protein
MKHKMTEADMEAQIARLVAMPDSDIDTDDIPEAPAENCGRSGLVFTSLGKGPLLYDWMLTW